MQETTRANSANHLWVNCCRLMRETPFEWFGGSEKFALHTAIDDATSTIKESTVVLDDSDPGFPEKYTAVNFHTRLLDSFLQEWLQRKKDLADGVISKAEYMEWKVNWPQTADDCGKVKPSKKWRKE